jgi:hypothetical protein
MCPLRAPQRWGDVSIRHANTVYKRCIHNPVLSVDAAMPATRRRTVVDNACQVVLVAHNKTGSHMAFARGAKLGLSLLAGIHTERTTRCKDATGGSLAAAHFTLYDRSSRLDIRVHG